MCISNNAYPAPRVDFRDTILYGAVVRNPQGQEEHILAYYNKVAAIAGTSADTNGAFGWDVAPAGSDDIFGWDVAPPAKKVGNAMLFAVPAVQGSLTATSLIPVRDFPHFMQDYKRAVARRERMTRSKGILFGTLGADSAAPTVVKGFDGGTYDVVIAPGGALQIAQVLGQVDEDKRPQLNEKLYNELNIAYPGFTFVLFCFSEADAEQAGCAMIRYTPMLPHLLYLPGLDGHNGFIERGQVELNHTLVLGSYRRKAGTGNEVHFTDRPLQGNALYTPSRGLPADVSMAKSLELTAQLPTRPYYVLDNVIGRVINEGTQAPQGDFWALVTDVEAGTFRVRRQVPPGWSKLPGSPADPAGGAFWTIRETTQGPESTQPKTLRG